MSKDEIMQNQNHELSEELRALDSQLDRLGQAEREAAHEGFEAGLLEAVGGALTPGPIPMPKGESGASRWTREIRLAAAVLLVGTVGLLTWTSAGLLGTRSATPTDGGGVLSELALAEDVDLLLELVGSDFGVSEIGGGVSFGAEVDDLSLDVLQMDSDMEPAWDSLESWVGSFSEGAI